MSKEYEKITKQLESLMGHCGSMKGSEDADPIWEEDMQALQEAIDIIADYEKMSPQYGEMTVHGMHVSPYEKGNIFNRDPLRPRRLLMHKREILRLFGKVKQDGYALVPLSVYFKGPRIKLEVGLCKGKKLYDKRDAAAARDAKREMDRARKDRSRY